jgi:hypothetical protein
MYFLLADTLDQSATWAATGLRSRGLSSLELITPAMLIHATSWEHRVGAEGVHTKVLFRAGATLDSTTVKGVLNRIPWLNVELFSHCRQEDREYVQQEFTALVMSALGALDCKVWNRPTAQGMGGAWRHLSEWTSLAGAAGMRTRPYQAPIAAAPPARHTAFVLGDRVVGAPSPLVPACVRLATLARTGLLGVEFDAGWTFTNATPQPDLRLGGEPLLDALAEGLAA